MVCLCFFAACSVKKSVRVRIQGSVRVHSVIGCTGSCGNTSHKQLLK